MQMRLEPRVGGWKGGGGNERGIDRSRWPLIGRGGGGEGVTSPDAILS